MNTEMSVKILMGLARVVGIAIGAGHVFGYLNFSSDHSFFMVVPAIALLGLSIVPARWMAQRSWLLWAVGGVTGLAYACIGFPFLDSANDAGARVIWLIEFILIIFLGSIRVVSSLRRIREALPM